MKTLRALVFGWMLAPGVVYGQNLVPNPGFDILDSCPDNLSQIEATGDWVTARGSVDLFNACDTAGYVDVPLNWAGFQQAYEGDGYAGLFSFLASDTLHREFMRAELSAPLSPGVPVYISFRMALGGWGTLPPTPDLSSSGVGVFFSTVPFWQFNYEPLPNWAAIASTSAMTDTSVWDLVSGVFVPDSAYTYVLVGNPLNASLLTTVVIDSSSVLPFFGYAYIDEVCVSEAPGDCPMLSAMAELDESAELLAFPNPCRDQLFLSASWQGASDLTYRLYNPLGMLVREGGLFESAGLLVLSTSDWPNGVFLLVPLSDGKVRSRILVEHISP